MQNAFKYLLLISSNLLVIYTFAVIADFMIGKINLKGNEESKKIYYQMKSSQTKEGFKLKDYEPILFNKMFLNKDQIINVGGQPNKNVFYCNEGYGLIKYKADRFGLRNEDKNWDSLSDESKTRVMFVGDSYFHGACVHNDDVISTKIQSYNDKELITYNIAMAGNNSIMNAYSIKVFLNKIKPKYLVIGIYANDRQKFLTDKYFYSQIDNINLSQEYFNNDREALNLSKSLVESIRKRRLELYKKKDEYFSQQKGFFNRAKPYLRLSNLTNVLVFLKEKYFFRLPDDTKTLINIANKECKTFKCTPIFTFIPSSDYWNNDKNQFIFKNHLEEYLESKKNIYLDFSKIIKFNDKNFYALKGGHLSPTSYNIISKKIYNEIN